MQIPASRFRLTLETTKTCHSNESDTSLHMDTITPSTISNQYEPAGFL